VAPAGGGGSEPCDLWLVLITDEKFVGYIIIDDDDDDDEGDDERLPAGCCCCC